MSRLLFRATGMAALAWALVPSCGGSGSDERPGGGSGGAGSAGAGSGGAGPTDGSVITPNTDGNLIVAPDGPINGTVGGLLEDAACAVESRSAERIALDMYLMLDSSLSMTDTIADNVTSKWQAVQKALTSFVNDASSAGLGVGLQYFPLIQPDVPLTCFNTGECKTGGPCAFLNACANTMDLVLCNTSADCNGGACDPLGACKSDREAFCAPPAANSYCDFPQNTDVCSRIGRCVARDVCDAAAYATPAVEVAPLPSAAMSIVASLTAHKPDGSTPTSAALSGALTHARALATASPSHRVVVVLATDGLPTECEPTAIAPIAALATTAAQGTPPISTFVIGVFAPQEQVLAQSNLDALAMAGTTGKAFLINTSQDVSAQFLATLNTIRTMALTCEYGIPKPDGGDLDYGAVNVRFTSGAGQKSTIGYAGGASLCAAAGGWYYDVDPVTRAPTKIQLCPTTCASAKSDPNAQINVLFGCKTVTIPR